MKNLKYLYSICVLIGSFAACQQQNLPFIESNTKCKCKEVKLGESDYYLTIPTEFEVEEARGKEGQLGYHIRNANDTTHTSAFIEIKPGHPIGGKNIPENSVAYAQSIILNDKKTWRLNELETGFFVSFSKKGKISLEVTSKNKNEVDFLIAVVSTLRKNNQ